MTPLQRTSDVRLWGATIEKADDAVPSRAYTPDELVTRLSGEVWRFAWAQVRHREDAEDVVMETFAAAFRDFGRVLNAENQACWLLAIAHRKVADVLRRKYRRVERPLLEGDVGTRDEMPSPTQFALRGALAALPEGQREVLTLKYVNGLSTEEIGRVTRRSAAAANSLLQRGRESLRAALGPDFETTTQGETR